MQGFAIPLEAMMRSSQEDKTPEPVVEAQIEELAHICVAYQSQIENGCPFKVGDIIKPRSTSALRSKDRPHVVLETIPHAQPFMTGDCTSNGFGARLDMRVAVLSPGNDCYAEYWVESHDFEAFQLPSKD